MRGMCCRNNVSNYMPPFWDLMPFLSQTRGAHRTTPHTPLGPTRPPSHACARPSTHRCGRPRCKEAEANDVGLLLLGDRLVHDLQRTRTEHSLTVRGNHKRHTQSNSHAATIVIGYERCQPSSSLPSPLPPPSPPPASTDGPLPSDLPASSSSLPLVLSPLLRR